MICNLGVVGSNPTRGSVLFGRIPEWPNGADCKSAVYDFGGSNPSAPTGNLEYKNAKIAQLVEHDLAKVGVAGSSPVFRSEMIFEIL